MQIAFKFEQTIFEGVIALFDSEFVIQKLCKHIFTFILK